MEHSISIEYEGAAQDAELDGLIRRVICTALEHEGVSCACEVNVLVCGGETIRQLNREYRDTDSETDVLSFPMFELAPGVPPGPEGADPGTGLYPLGDMALNIDRIYSQAEEFGHSRLRETAYLTAHSVLHLLGYDHTDEGEMKRQMRQREEGIMDRLGAAREAEK